MDNYYNYLVAMIADKGIWDYKEYSKLLHTLYSNHVDVSCLRDKDTKYIKMVTYRLRDDYEDLKILNDFHYTDELSINFLECFVSIAVCVIYEKSNTSKVFFEMLNSLYIDRYDNKHFNEENIIKTLRNWNNYEYDDFGNGNIFRFPNKIPNLKEKDLYVQKRLYDKEEICNE